MGDTNVVVQVGRLTRDAELKYTPGGCAVCHFSIANNWRKKQGEEWKEEANFFEVTLYGRAAEAINQYLLKGKQVSIQGQLRQERWQHEGQSRSKVVIIADSVQLLGSKNEGQGGGYDPDAARKERERMGRAPKPGAPDNRDDFNDDIPF